MKEKNISVLFAISAAALYAINSHSHQHIVIKNHNHIHEANG